MILKTVSEIYICFSILVFFLSYLSWRIKARVGYPKFIVIFQMFGIVLQSSYVFFSCFYLKPLSFYSEINRIINNLPSAVCGFFIIVAILCMEIPCVSRITKKYAAVSGKMFLKSMPDKVREIQTAKDKNYISEIQAIRKQELFQKKISFFEKMSKSASIVYKYTLISGIGLSTLNFLLSFAVRKIFLSYSLEKAFISAVVISLWNLIVFSLPEFLLSFGILKTCSVKNLRKVEKEPRINKKMHLVGKKTKSLRKKKNKNNKISNEIDKTKDNTIKIKLGFGLIQLINETSDFVLNKTIEKLKNETPFLPEIEISDCAIFQTWEYHIEYGNTLYKDYFTGTETYETMVKIIINYVKMLDIS